jgi:hypothetical protein
VIITLPGVTWKDVRSARMPALGALIERGAVGAVATRTAVGKPSADRGYLTLGAGSRAFLGPAGKRITQPVVPDPQAQAAYAADDPVEGGRALDALRRRVGGASRGSPDIVHLGVAYLQSRQNDGLYEATVGALGDALERAKVARAVVSAADVAASGDSSSYRRGAVTSIMDSKGTVDKGVLHGLLRRDPHAPFGVVTDARSFERALQMSWVSVYGAVVVEPGETARADEYSASVAPAAVPRMRREALERADRLIAIVESTAVRTADIFVVGTSPPSAPGTTDHLTPVVAAGPGIQRGWLSSPTTKQRGQVTLTDVAPTVLSILGIRTPKTMIGRPMFSIAGGGSDRVRTLDELDTASVFRERFAAAAFWVIATVISVFAIAAALVCWRRRRSAYAPVTVFAYASLAFFPAAFLLRLGPYWRLGQLGAHAALYVLTAVLAVAAWAVPGPRWRGTVVLLPGSAALFTLDALRAGPLQVNGVFGHSPVVAGRFYGIGNVGTTIIFCAAILGLATLGEARRWRVAPWWIGAVLAAVVLVDGLPQFGADFGGLLTGVVAVALVVRLSRGLRVDAKWLVWSAVLAVVLTAGASLVDLLRPPEVRTHLGRFAETLRYGGLNALGLIVRRKAASQLGSLAVTRWTYALPGGVAGLAALVAFPRGLMSRVLSDRPQLRAGLWGVIAVGVVGFAVNDSGISITAIALAHAIALLALFAVEAVDPRDAPGSVAPVPAGGRERVFGD